MKVQRCVALVAVLAVCAPGALLQAQTTTDAQAAAKAAPAGQPTYLERALEATRADLARQEALMDTVREKFALAQQSGRGGAAGAGSGSGPTASQLTGFSIVLVQGEPMLRISNEGLPEPVRKALADMKDFLPFKSYALLDSAWVRSKFGAVKSRLRGPGGGYSVEIKPNSWGPDSRSLDLTFIITSGPDTAPAVVMSTRFQMQVGETVVVGTSRMGSDRALIALVTALADGK